MKTHKNPKHFFLIESRDNGIHGKLLTYKANSFRIKREMKFLHNKYNLEKAYSGRLCGKVIQEAAYKGVRCGKMKSTGLGVSQADPGFSSSFPTECSVTGQVFLDGAVACWLAEWDSTSQKLRRAKVPCPALNGRFPAWGSLTSDRGRRDSVVQSSSCQRAALSPIPGTMQKEKWRVHRERRELMICEPRLLAFSIQTSGLDA